MTNYEEILNIPPYSLGKVDKEKLFMERLGYLFKHHYDNCKEYKKITDLLYEDNKKEIESYPFLPVRIFKDFDLKSISEDEVVKTMTSSGTTGQSVSKIYLDKTTAANQQNTLIKIVSDFIGKARIPMLIIDSPSVIKNREMFSARGAGILGFSIFGSKKKYVLDDNMEIDIEGTVDFLKEHEGETIMVFGFTFMIWEYFYKKLKEKNVRIDLSNGIMIHGGGWKKLINEAVSPEEFKKSLNDVCGINKVHDYYGMVEQTGCIYMECEYGHLHASIFSDIIIRRERDFSVCENGEEGIIQVISLIPESYPGQSILTEDKGIILGEDDCPCGRKGKYFKITGRIKNAEVRGCSDTYEKH